MKQWTFIPALGSGTYTEVETVQRQGFVCLDIPTIGASWFPINVLSVVGPSEPAELGWYLAQIGDNEEIVRKVEPEGWSVGRNAGFLSTWKTLNEDFPGITMVRLVPVPEPVELPWEHKDREFYPVSVTESQRSWAACRVNSDGADLTPDACREMARALNTAADQAEAATS